jgi:hypothetical protein
MEPQPLGPADWTHIDRALVLLVLFVALAINAASAFLLGLAVLPSLVDTAELPLDLLRLRRVVLPIGLASAVLMLIALSRGLSLAVEVASRIYPRGAV